MTTTPTYPDSIRSPSRRWLSVAGAALVLLLLIGTVWSLSGGAKPAPQPVLGDQPQWFTVQKRSFDLTVTAAGELAARENIEIKCQIEGQAVISWVIDEGSAVKQGDLLMTLDDADLLVKIEQADLDAERSRTEFLAATEDLAVKQNEAAQKQKAAEVKLALAKLELAKWTQGEDIQKQRELELKLEKARRTLTRAQRDVELSSELYKERFISLNELEDDQTKLIEATSELATAELDLKVYREFTRPKEQRRVQTEVEQATTELDTTLKRNDITLETAHADVLSKERTLKIRDDRLEKLRIQLELSRITAPADGLVVYATSTGSRRFRGEPIVQGRTVRFNETMLVLPDTRQMVAELKVHEALLAQVQVGQPVNVTIDARPGETLRGQVTTIAVTAEDGGWINPDLREYRVRVDLPPLSDSQDATGLKPGMRCSGQVVTGSVEQALAVPVQAVHARAKQRHVYTAALMGNLRRQPVTLGRVGELYAEILTGLKVGDRVLLRAPAAGEIEEDDKT